MSSIISLAQKWFQAHAPGFVVSLVDWDESGIRLSDWAVRDMLGGQLPSFCFVQVIMFTFIQLSLFGGLLCPRFQDSSCSCFGWCLVCSYSRCVVQLFYFCFSNQDFLLGQRFSVLLMLFFLKTFVYFVINIWSLICY